VYQSEHYFCAIKRSIPTEIATCGLAEETEKKEKKVGEENTKPLYFTIHVEAPFRNRSAPNLVSLPP